MSGNFHDLSAGIVSISLKHPTSNQDRQRATMNSLKDSAGLAKRLEINVSKLIVQRTKSPKALRPSAELTFGKNFTGPPSSCIRQSRAL